MFDFLCGRHGQPVVGSGPDGSAQGENRHQKTSTNKRKTHGKRTVQKQKRLLEHTMEPRYGEKVQSTSTASDEIEAVSDGDKIQK